MSRRVALGCTRRRGAVAVLVAVCMVVMLGFAALTIDVGAMYNARSDLQRAADAAALAAAARLSEYEIADPVSMARSTAQEVVGMNPVLGKIVGASDEDVTFLRSNLSGGQYVFSQTELFPDAVRVTVRLDEQSPNGPLNLFFAPIFGKQSTTVSASATAGMVPRDIALVADVSASHTDDSELKKYRTTNINLFDVWSALPGGFDDATSTWSAADPLPQGDLRQAAGPGWGAMKRLGFGTIEVGPGYNPTSDTGLAYLPYRQNWTNAALTGYLADQKYSPDEISAIMNGGSDSSTTYPYRVAVALGLADWNSGLPGGRWTLLGAAPGNTDTSIAGAEVNFAESFLGRTPSESSAIWLDYITDYAMSSNTSINRVDSGFRYRYGIKTFLNYILEERPEPSQTWELADLPIQPMQAVKDAVSHMMENLTALGSDDRISLEAYSTIGSHVVDLTDDYEEIGNSLRTMQAAHFGQYTNIGGGLQRAIEELSGPRARKFSSKVIVLYTDGIANINRNLEYDLAGAKQYAWDMAVEAARRGFRIYAVSVGSEPDRAFMDRIAELGDGEHFHAEGSIEQYSVQLDHILNLLSAKRPVQLIE